MGKLLSNGDADYSSSVVKPSLRWLVIGSSTYGLYACVADLLAALRSSLNWSLNYTVSSF